MKLDQKILIIVCMIFVQNSNAESTNVLKDSLYIINVIDTLPSDGLHSFFVTDSTYDFEKNEVVLKVIYFDKGKHKEVIVGKQYKVSSTQWNPGKFLVSDEVYYTRGSCGSDFSLAYYKDCYELTDSVSFTFTKIDNCTPIRIIYYEVFKVKTLPNK